MHFSQWIGIVREEVLDAIASLRAASCKIHNGSILDGCGGLHLSNCSNCVCVALGDLSGSFCMSE